MINGLDIHVNNVTIALEPLNDKTSKGIDFFSFKHVFVYTGGTQITPQIFNF